MVSDPASSSDRPALDSSASDASLHVAGSERVRSALERISAGRDAARLERASEESFERGLAQRAMFPWVTYSLIAINLIVWGMMIASGVSFWDPGTKEIFEWGGCDGPAIRAGDWWRLFSANYLHYGILHIACNMYVLRDWGPYTERLYGRTAFLALYVLSGLGGSVLCVLWTPMICCAGASGAIFGVLGAQCALVLVKKHAMPMAVLRRISKSAILFAGYSLFEGAISPDVSNSTHLGGLLTGALVAACLPVTSTRSGDPERVRPWRFAIPCLILAAGAAAIPHRINDLRQRARDHYRAASAAYEGRDDTRALQEIFGSVELDPTSSAPYELRGLVFLRMKERAAAIAEFDLAIQYGAGNTSPYLRRGWAQQDGGDLAAAKKDFEEVIRLDPESGEGHFALAWVSAQSEDWPRAMSESTRAIEIGGRTLAMARGLRGIIHFVHRRFPEALADCRQAADAPDFRVALFAWAARLEIDGRKAAEEELRTWRTRSDFAGKTDVTLSIGAYLLGEIEAAELRLRAGKPAVVAANGQRTAVCDSEYFIALKCRLDGDRAGYESALAKCIETHAIDSVGYPCAKAERGR